LDKNKGCGNFPGKGSCFAHFDVYYALLVSGIRKANGKKQKEVL